MNMSCILLLLINFLVVQIFYLFCYFPVSVSHCCFFMLFDVCAVYNNLNLQNLLIIRLCYDAFGWGSYDDF